MMHRRDALSYAFQQDRIGLGMDFAVKLNCDEAEGRKMQGCIEERERGQQR